MSFALLYDQSPGPLVASYQHSSVPLSIPPSPPFDTALSALYGLPENSAQVPSPTPKSGSRPVTYHTSDTEHSDSTVILQGGANSSGRTLKDRRRDALCSADTEDSGAEQESAGDPPTESSGARAGTGGHVSNDSLSALAAIAQTAPTLPFIVTGVLDVLGTGLAAARDGLRQRWGRGSDRYKND